MRVDESWWRHQMETFSAKPTVCVENPPVTGEFPPQRPLMRNFDVFFDLCLNKRLKQSRRQWSETPSCSLWRHCNRNRVIPSTMIMVDICCEYSPGDLHRFLCISPLRWRHDVRDDVSNHQPHDCLLNRLFRQIWKNSKLRVTGLCEGNSPVTGEFPAQRASNTENVSIWWRHHDTRNDPGLSFAFASVSSDLHRTDRRNFTLISSLAITVEEKINVVIHLLIYRFSGNKSIMKKILLISSHNACN